MVALEMNSVEDNLEDGVQTLIRKINQSRYKKLKKCIVLILFHTLTG